MSYPHHYRGVAALAVVGVGVGDQQPPGDERIPLGDQWGGQLGAGDPPSGGTALLVNTNQPQQPGDDLLAPSATGGDRLGQRRVGLASQRTLHPAELLIARGRQLATVADTLGKVGQSERQQRQRLPRVSIGNQPGHQVLVDGDPGHPGRPFDHRTQSYSGMVRRCPNVRRTRTEAGWSGP
jgi:hypothetical protein